MSEPKSAIRVWLVVALLIVWAAGVAHGQTPAQQLESAITSIEANDPEPALPVLHELLASGRLDKAQRTEARKYLGLGHLFLGQEDEAVEVFKDLVGDAPEFRAGDLVYSYTDTPTDYHVRYFAQATLEWRQEQLERRRARLAATSRQGAVVRSLLLPGLGQRYQGYRGRSWAILGLAGASTAYAILADQSFRDARDTYDSAELGADFDGLWDDYTQKSDTADTALGIAVAVWALNLVDAALTGPNLSGLELFSLAPTSTPGGAQLSMALEF